MALSDPARTIDTAARSTLLLGILLLCMTPCAVLPGLILEGTGNPFAQAEGKYHFVMALILLIAAVALIVLGMLVRRRQTWAAVLAIILLCALLGLAALFTLGSLLLWEITGIIAGLIFMAMFVALIVQLSLTFPAFRAERESQARGFEPRLNDAQTATDDQ